MPSIDNLFGIHSSALKLREQRMSMLASNIANAATPGYKARDIDFSSALKMAESGQSPEAAIRFRIPVQPSLDGNTVELATEQTAFAKNALAYRSCLSFLNGRIPAPALAQIDLTTRIDLKAEVEQMELERIQAALAYADGVISEAARMLTLKRTALIEKMRTYRLEKIAA